MDKEQLRERKARRTSFLAALYEKVDGDVNEFVHGFEIAETVGADSAEAKKILAYFEEKRMIVIDDHKAGIIRITAEGVDSVEDGAN